MKSSTCQNLHEPVAIFELRIRQVTVWSREQQRPQGVGLRFVKYARRARCLYWFNQISSVDPR